MNSLVRHSYMQRLFDLSKNRRNGVDLLRCHKSVLGSHKPVLKTYHGQMKNLLSLDYLQGQC